MGSRRRASAARPAALGLLAPSGRHRPARRPEQHVPSGTAKSLRRERSGFWDGCHPSPPPTHAQPSRPAPGRQGGAPYWTNDLGAQGQTRLRQTRVDGGRYGWEWGSGRGSRNDAKRRSAGQIFGASLGRRGVCGASNDGQQRPLTTINDGPSAQVRASLVGLTLRVTDELACTPDFVRGDLSPLGGHPSRRAVAGMLVRPTRRLGRAALERLRRPPPPRRRGPCLALLRVGFT